MTAINRSWYLSPANLVLSDNEIHVWRASLDQPAAYVGQLRQTLSPDERSRAERFQFERDRRRFIVGRGVLRAILGYYLSLDPGRLQFRYGPRGKPCLSEELGGDTLQFNLAHSHELALYAFTAGREIGIDLEYIRPIPDIEQIAARFFSASENATWRILPANQKQEAFFNCWTRKEAYLKATGNGLAQPLDQFDVSLAPGEPVRLLRVRGASEEVSRWSLAALTPAPGYVAAVAIEGHDWHLSCWQYQQII